MFLTHPLGNIVGTPGEEGFQFEEIRAVSFVFLFHQFCTLMANFNFKSKIENKFFFMLFNLFID